MADRYKLLNAREDRFVAAYLELGDGRAAAIKAGYSPKTASAQASRLLTRDHLRSHIESAQRARSEEVGIDQAWVLREAVALYQRLVNDIKPALHPKTRRQLKTDSGELLFAFQAGPALKALDLIGRHVNVGAWEERVHVTAETTMVERLQAARLRLRRPPLDASVIDVSPRALQALPIPIRSTRGQSIE
jgi:phage terminase small subunit